jgi:flavin reductase (DIM6/NTAB) family NADH-FMN oxidoreductase RutF
MLLDPDALSQPDRYKLLIGGITPRPIAWISTIEPAPGPTPTGLASAGPRLNLAPFSFFAGLGSEPMTLLFCPANKPDGSEKDSLRNAKPLAEGGSGEFVVNTVPHALARHMAMTAAELPYGDSELELPLPTPLTTAPSAKVRAPRLADAPVAFECRTIHVYRTNPGVPNAGNLVVGRVVAVHVLDGAINDRLHIDPAAVDHVGRMGGMGYCTTRDRFDLPRGIAPGGG